MRTHRTPPTTRRAAAFAFVALGVTASCGGDDDDGSGGATATTVVEQVSPTTIGEISGAAPAGDALEEAVLRLEGISNLEPGRFVLGDPFEEYGVSVEMYTLTVDSLADIRAELPDVSELPSEGEETYDAVLAHLDEWAELATASLAELEQRRAELEPLAVEWATAGGDDVAPPEEYAELVGANAVAFEDFVQRCAEFAVSVDVAINCFGTPAPGVDGSVEFTAGGTTFAVDPGPIDEYIVRPDFFGADLGPAESMSISAPFPVRDPASTTSVDAEPGVLLEHTVAWPDDLDGYLAASPFEVIDDTTVTTPAGEFRRLTFAQDDSRALLFMDDPGGSLIVWQAMPLTVWVGEVEGQTLIAALRVTDQRSFDEYAPQLEAALATISVVGG